MSPLVWSVCIEDCVIYHIVTGQGHLPGTIYSISIVQSYTGKYHEVVAVHFVMSAHHE